MTTTTGYDQYCNIVVPIIRRLLNLECLYLYLTITDFHKKDRLLHGYHLEKSILDYLPRLSKLTFDIYSIMLNPVRRRSNEYIQNTFSTFKDQRIISSIDYFEKENIAECHMYSIPHTAKYYENITNSFPGGLFKHVREISLFDERPFEHEFFIRIAQSFPFIESLSIRNKQSQKSNKNKNGEYFPITYPYLRQINLILVNDDYVEQFLDDTKTCLPKNITFNTAYECLQNVTHHFTREETRNNCAKITMLEPCHQFILTEEFRMYFPLVDPQSMVPKWVKK